MTPEEAMAALCLDPFNVELLKIVLADNSVKKIGTLGDRELITLIESTSNETEPTKGSQ